MPLQSEIALRTARTEDWNAIEEFYREHQDAAARTLELYAWRERGARVSGGNHPMLAFDGSKLCGIINSVPTELCFRGKRVPAAWHHDSLVDSSMRGRGVGKKLTVRTAETARVI